MGGKKKKAPKKIKQVRRRKDQSASTLASPPPWIELPPDITANILHRLGAIDILESAEKVCRTWRNVCKDPSMWREIDMHNLGDFTDMPYNLETMCRHVVDRSQGQLVDLNVDYFCTDELLEYIAERAGQLRRLTVASCYDLCDERLGGAAKKFPLLEELHLLFTNISQLEGVGHSCQLLKSLTLRRHGSRCPCKCDMEAFAIAKTMPELRHLGLIGIGITNEGLQAILDGCPHLESLDLRQCFNIDLTGEIGKRCSQQIKCLMRPHDSTEGCNWDTTIFDGEYVSGFSDLDLLSDDGEFYSDYDEYDDYCHWANEDSDSENFFGFFYG